MAINKKIKIICFLGFLLRVAEANLADLLLDSSHDHNSPSASRDSPDIGTSAVISINIPSLPPPSKTVTDCPTSGPGAFDVKKYGAVADGKTESGKGFLAAWQAACSYNGKASVVVPEGDYLLGPVAFQGPCQNNPAPAFVIQGTLKAIRDRAVFPDDGWISFEEVQGLTVTGGGTIDGQGADAWEVTSCPKDRKCHIPPSSLKLAKVTNGSVHDLYLVNSKAFHLSLLRADSINVYNMDIKAPEDSPNTDGIHVSRSTNVNITSSVIGVGDDCVSLGSGNVGISVSNVVCGPGHGISLGSLGKYPSEEPVSGISVHNCTLTGTTNGVRIKTWQDSPALQASNITFEDIVMNNVQFPIIIDQKYCPASHCTADKPSQVQISNVKYKNIRGTSFTKLAVNLVCSADLPCKDVHLTDINLTYQDPQEELRSLCYNVKVTTDGVQKPAPCLLTNA